MSKVIKRHQPHDMVVCLNKIQRNYIQHISKFNKNYKIEKFPGGKRSASATKRYEDKLKRDRLEYERKYNRPAENEEEAHQAATYVSNDSGEDYNPLSNGI